MKITHGALLFASLLLVSTSNAQLVTNTLTPMADMWYDERSFAYTDNPPASLYGPTGNDFLDLAPETESYTERIVMRFDLSSVPVGSLRSATLRLFNRASPAGGTTDPLDVFRLTNPWVDKNSNWLTNDVPNATLWNNPGSDFANRLGIAQSLSNPFATRGYDRSSVNAPNDWDVTSLVQLWLDGIHPNYGFLITERMTADHGQAFFWASETGALSPQLIIVTPEPSGLALMLLGGLVLLRRR